MKPWIVLYQNNVRIVSFLKTKKQLKSIQNLFIFDVIQEDINGTLHINIYGLIDKNRRVEP